MKPVKCIISGLDENQDSRILDNKNIEMVTPYEAMPCFQLQNLFYTEDSPQNLNTRHNNSEYDINLPDGAMRILKMRMPTQKELEADMLKAGQEPPKDWYHFNIHSTDSIDYIYILSGSVTYVVGDERTQLTAGDFLAQIGPEHTWVNTNDEPCLLICIMQGIKPSGKRKDMVL